MQDSLDEFLASVELRAFHLVRLKLGNPDDAHDVVQDGMERFVSHYRDRPREEWTRLFYGIIHNRVRDYYRHGQVKKRLIKDSGQDEDDRQDPLERVEGPAALRPEEQVGTERSMESLVAAISDLPQRQQEAVTLRVIQGLDVEETAQAMGCSQGSVKTHLSRALASLREVLGEHR